MKFFKFHKQEHVKNCPIFPMACSNQECRIQIPRQNVRILDIYVFLFLIQLYFVDVLVYVFS